MTLTAGQQHAISMVAPPCFRAESVLSPCPARSQRPPDLFSLHGHPAPDADSARSSSGSPVHRSRRKHGAVPTHALRTDNKRIRRPTEGNLCGSKVRTWKPLNGASRCAYRSYS
ncbi:hypothetical protein K7A41_01920 [Sphingobacterium sp. InxBP1]|uniref:hypothetical protein n=1 Tax=Sphingobacterium sp. InxBP1 TaxID=2870328 RepID=UPI0022449AAA|nr:hypothetical protein [Sphingobacterium sp. InxBP1]MCW8309972.1 hypothetical protein [Sphingobacterium sp. InxBP1]